MSTHLLPLLRSLVRRPGATGAAVATLALGLAATGAIVSVVDTVLVRPLPYAEPERLVAVRLVAPGLGLEEDFGLSEAAYQVFRTEARGIVEIGLYEGAAVNLAGDGAPERVDAMRLTPSLLATLGADAALGRRFTEREGRRGAPEVLLLGHDLWRHRFGGERDVLGRRLRVDGVEREVVGVMPEGFRVGDLEAELFLPLPSEPADADAQRYGIDAVARLAPGARPEVVAAHLTDLFLHRVTERYPSDGLTAEVLAGAGFATLAVPLREHLVGDVRPVLSVLLAGVGLLLLVACANAANLLLVRSEVRSRELAVRAAVGAGRRGVAELLLAEGVLLGIAAAVLAVPLAAGVLRVLLAYAPAGLPRLGEVAFGPRAAALVALAAVLAGVAAGLLPALRFPAGDLAGALREAGGAVSSSPRRRRVRVLLVAGQIALAVVLVAASALMLRSFLHLRQVDPGFTPGGVLSVRLALPEATHPEPGDVASFHARLLGEVRAVPGVEAAGIGSGAPLVTSSRTGHHAADRPLEPGALPPVFFLYQVSPGYLDAMGAELVAGRFLDEADLALESVRGARSAVVSESVARRYWPGQEALGRRIGPGRVDDPDEMFEVVGVVRDVREKGLEDEPQQTVYYPLVRAPYGDAPADVPRQVSLLVRSSLPPLSLAPALRRAVARVDDDVPIADVRTLEQVVARSTARTTFTALLLVLGALLALALGAVGLYAVVSYSVGRRTREMGLRAALGATPWAIERLIVGQGLAIAGLGVAAGIAGALAAGGVLAAVTVGVEPRDPATLATVAAILLAVALVATYLPARRAARVDPKEALGAE